MATETVVFGAADAKIYPLLTDASGGATYGAAIDIPGLQTIEVSGKASSKEARGDNRIIAKISALENVGVKLEFAQWDADVFATFTGATTTTDEDGSWESALTTSSAGQYFKLEAVSLSADGSGSNTNIILHKVVVIGLPTLSFSDNEFSNVTVEAEALPLANGDWVTTGFNTTAKVLS